jgi:RNA polymerase sigma-70 factor (ECF subfamily)
MDACHNSGLHVASKVDYRLAIVERSPVTASPVAEDPDSAALVAAARDGDRSAFGRLYDRYARMVHGILLARVRPSDADDLVQDVFILAMRRIQSLRDVASFGAWLAAIARNRANDYHRQSRETVEFSEELYAERTDGKPVSNTQDIEAAATLAAIRSLPEAYQETLLLRLVEGMTGPEIAARTGLSHGSVRVNLHRGMQQLREKLGILREGQA